MKITLTYQEAIDMLREHEALNHLEDAEIVIEGVNQGQTEDLATENTVEVKKRKRKTKTEVAAEPVTQETVNTIVSEVEQELEGPVQQELSFEEHEMSLIDEVLQEEVQEPVEEPTEELFQTSQPLDLDGPLFT